MGNVVAYPSLMLTHFFSIKRFIECLLLRGCATCGNCENRYITRHIEQQPSQAQQHEIIMHFTALHRQCKNMRPMNCSPHTVSMKSAQFWSNYWVTSLQIFRDQEAWEHTYGSCGGESIPAANKLSIWSSKGLQRACAPKQKEDFLDLEPHTKNTHSSWPKLCLYLVVQRLNDFSRNLVSTVRLISNEYPEMGSLVLISIVSFKTT